MRVKSSFLSRWKFFLSCASFRWWAFSPAAADPEKCFSFHHNWPFGVIRLLVDDMAFLVIWRDVLLLSPFKTASSTLASHTRPHWRPLFLHTASIFLSGYHHVSKPWFKWFSMKYYSDYIRWVTKIKTTISPSTENLGQFATLIKKTICSYVELAHDFADFVWWCANSCFEP